MRHRHSRQRLKQKPAHAKMLLRNLATSLILYERVRTTKKRAQVVQPIVDRLIATAKSKEPYVAIRSINRVVMDRNASRKLMEVLRERYKDRPSGFTAMRAIGARQGDGASLVDLTLIADKDPPARTPAAKTAAAETKKPQKRDKPAQKDEKKTSSSAPNAKKKDTPSTTAKSES